MRVLLGLALSLSLVACSSEQPVDLLIFEGPMDGCSVSGGYQLDLVVDPVSGTVAGANVAVWGMYPIVGDGPIWWPSGYTARRDGSEVVVYNANRQEVAKTGARCVLGLPFDVLAARHRLVACYLGPA